MYRCAVAKPEVASERALSMTIGLCDAGQEEHAVIVPDKPADFDRKLEHLVPSSLRERERKQVYPRGGDFGCDLAGLDQQAAGFGDGTRALARTVNGLVVESDACSLDKVLGLRPRFEADLCQVLVGQGQLIPGFLAT